MLGKDKGRGVGRVLLGTWGDNSSVSASLALPEVPSSQGQPYKAIFHDPIMSQVSLLAKAPRRPLPLCGGLMRSNGCVTTNFTRH